MAIKGRFSVGTNPREFSWDETRIAAAALLSQGLTVMQTATELRISDGKLANWRTFRDFMQRVDDLTLECEFATRAGLLREAMTGLTLKREMIDSDRSTHLDYIKEIADLQGLKKTQVEHTGGVKLNVTISEAISEYEGVLEGLGQ